MEQHSIGRFGPSHEACAMLVNGVQRRMHSSQHRSQHTSPPERMLELLRCPGGMLLMVAVMCCDCRVVCPSKSAEYSSRDSSPMLPVGRPSAW